MSGGALHAREADRFVRRGRLALVTEQVTIGKETRAVSYTSFSGGSLPAEATLLLRYLGVARRGSRGKVRVTRGESDATATVSESGRVTITKMGIWEPDLPR